MSKIFRFAELEFNLVFFILSGDTCLKRIIERHVSLARWIHVENVDFSLPQGYFLLPMLTAEVNHFKCQISLAESLDILCSIRGCCRADLGALLWGGGNASACGMGNELLMQEAPMHKKIRSPNLWRRSRPWSHFPNVWIQNCQGRPEEPQNWKCPVPSGRPGMYMIW